MTTRIVVFGAAGRLGSAIVRAAQTTPGVAIAAALVRKGAVLAEAGMHPAQALAYDSELRAGVEADVILEATGAAGFDAALALALKRRLALVSGSTGLDATQRTALATAAKGIPVLCAANFSLGAALLARLARMAAATLGRDFEVEILETHHRAKRDAPSGTAIMLGEAVASERGTTLADAGRLGRGPDDPPPSRGEIGIASLRLGDVVGEHTVSFAGPGERIELTHRATTRDVFAIGALRAAQWVRGRPAGLYSMDDVLDPASR
ncbi:MAG TPA: 4-hydroxy-tetrahydrodipicolinate reductase [Xanthomonadales bacterium]|nr:4-hydroxy-tetrahydrodipicolinate reductase [Xanthomonadales bacterium]